VAAGTKPLNGFLKWNRAEDEAFVKNVRKGLPAVKVLGLPPWLTEQSLEALRRTIAAVRELL